MNLLGDRKTKEYIKHLKPKYRMNARKGEYSITFTFQMPSGFILKATGKALKIFRVKDVDLDKTETWALSEVYYPKLLKKITLWLDEVQQNTRKKHNNRFTFVGKHLEDATFTKNGSMYDCYVKIRGTYSD